MVRLTHAQAVDTGPFLPRREGPGDEATRRNGSSKGGHSDQETVNHGSVDQLVQSTSVET